MRVSLIAAVARNGVIGRENRLPWHLPGDLAHFKRLTLGHAMIMGRRTYESIGRPLPKRTTIVVTRRGLEAPPAGVKVARSLDEALALAAAAPGADEVFVAGGEEIFRLALPRADRLYLTDVDAEIEGDVRFPPFDEREWRCVEKREAPPEADPAAPRYTFRTLERARAAS